MCMDGEIKLTRATIPILSRHHGRKPYVEAKSLSTQTPDGTPVRQEADIVNRPHTVKLANFVTIPPIPQVAVVPAPVFREPAGTLGTPNQAHARLKLDLGRSWARYPRDMRTISWEDLLASKRRDVVIVYQATICYIQAEQASRSKWLSSKIGRIQIPVELASDRSFLLEHRDALYLERMHD